MNALMNIQIRVLSAQAQSEIKALRARVRELELQLAGANAAASRFGAGGTRALEKWGSQLQWAGRQLQYNFTLPIALAAGAATKFSLDNEKAMTRLKKVYGDGIHGAQFYGKEIEALGRAFESMSNEFGVARADVINIAADWAAAGASGLALAKNTRLTIETMILGEMDAQAATQSLIAIQAQYGQSTKDLATTIDILNQVENQTGASMSGLIDGFVRAAGVARDAGIDVRHLAAMIAALVPSAGSAATAGNAIKTIISRLLSPTKEAAEVMGLMGINTAKMSWESLNGTQRLEAMAKKFNSLDRAQKIVVSSTIASRWQINKFSTLMRDITNVNGYYQKALEATIDPLANQAQKVRELNQVLDSSPQKFKQVMTVMQNVLADAIQPLLPSMIRIAQAVTGVLQKFGELDPRIQGLIIGFLLLLAAIGPIMRYMGSIATLAGYAGAAFIKMGGGVKWALTFLWAFAKAPFKIIWAGIGLISTALLGLPGAIMKGLMFLPWLVRGLGSLLLQGLGFIIVSMQRLLTVGILRTLVLGFRGAATAAAAAFLSPWGLVIAAVIGLFVYFRDDLYKIWDSIQNAWRGNANNLAEAFAPVVTFFQKAVQFIADAFWKLPQGVRDAMMAVVRLVQQAADFVGGLFGQMLAPLRSTPTQSQVNKTAKTVAAATGGRLRGPGTGTSDSMLIRASTGEFVVNAHATSKHLSTLEAINSDRYWRGGIVGYAGGGTVTKTRTGGGGGTAGMTADVAAYQRIADALNGIKWNQEMRAVAKGFAQALPLFKRLLGDYTQLNALAVQQAAAVTRQEAVVAAWKARLDQANASLDNQQKKLDGMQGKLDQLTAAYDRHKQALDNYANAPIKGTQAMSDAIFANQMAQKKLQLQMMQWEKQHGSIDKVKNSMALLQGEIEKMQGNISDLRAGGAGSDITGPLEAQVKSMQASYAQMGNAVNNSPITQMQQQLDDLQQQGQMLDLEQSIKFDPLNRQIDQLANGMKELPFDQIIAGIKREQAAMAQLQPQIDTQNAAIEKQKAVIDQATAARDAVQARYDAEQKALDALSASYQKTADAVRNVEDAMRGLSTAANDNIQKAKEAAQNKLSPGAQNFLNAKGANFPEVGTNAKIGREGGIGDQSAAIDQWLKETAKGINFDNLDIFAPLKDMWNKAWAWVEQNIMPTVKRIWDAVYQFVSDIFGGSAGSSLFSGIGESFKSIWETLQGWWSAFVEGIKKVWALFGDDIMQVFGAIGDFFKRIWNEVAPGIMGLLGAILDLAKALWPVIETVAKLIGGTLVFAFKLISSIISNTLGPVLNFVIDVFNGIIQVARGVIDFFAGIFTLDFGRAFGGLASIVDGIWDTIFGIFNGVAQTIWGIVKGLVMGIVNFFKWLWDTLVGHSIIPDMINAIVQWFQNAWKWVVEKVTGLVNGVVEWFKLLPGRVWDALVTLKDNLANTATTAFQWFKDRMASGWNTIWTWLSGLPQATWNAVIAIKDKLFDVAAKAFTSFLDRQKTGWTNIWNWLVGLPQKTWDAVIAIKDKLFDVAAKAFTAFLDREKTGWTNIWNWLVTLPQKTWDGVISIKDKLFDVAAKAFTAFKDRMSTGWSNIWTWLSGLPQSAWNAIIGIKDKLATIGHDAMTGFFNKIKDMWNSPTGIFAWFKNLPTLLGNSLKTIGSFIANTIKNAWNTAANWISDHAIEPINTVASKFGFSIGRLPTFEKGGIVPGGYSKKDNMLIGARSGEGVLVPEAVHMLGGKKNLEELNRSSEKSSTLADWLRKTGIVPARQDFATGGPFGIGGPIGGGSPIDWLKQGAGNAVEGILRPVAAWIKAHIPPEMLGKFLSNPLVRAADVAATWGAITPDTSPYTGGVQRTVWPVGNAPITAGFPNYPSGRYHGGIDFGVPTGTQVHAFRAGRVIASGWDSSGYGNAIRILHNNGYQSIYGHNRVLTRSVNEEVQPGMLIALSDSTGNSTGPHLHFGIKRYNGAWLNPMPFLRGQAFDRGGWLMPGMTQTRNNTGAPEPVFTAEQWTILKGLVVTASTMLKSMTDGASGGGFGPSGVRMSQIEQRLRALESKSTVTQQAGGTTVNINGDLVLPNIRSGDDAEKFIEHLKILAG